MADLTAIIVGGGVGGLTAALALRKVGVHATVYERTPSLEAAQVGGGIHLWSNALHVYRHVGIDDAIRAAGAEQGMAEFCSWRGPVLATWKVGEISDHVGLPTIGVSRADLHPVLTRAVGEDSVVTGALCTGFAEDATGVTARFADGREERADLLIGADGISSAVRSQIHGLQPHRYSGYTIWQAIIDYPTDQAPADHFRVMWGQGRRFSYYRVGGGRLYWFAVANAPAREKDPEEGKAAMILQRLGDWPEPVPSMIRATGDEAISREDMRDRPPAKRWGEGWVTLLGDAAHAMTFNVGQGACQAVEDAAALARHLSTAGDVPTALRAYEVERIKRTTPIVKLAWRLGSFGRWENPAACRFRDVMLRVVLSTVALRNHERDMAYDAWDDRQVVA
ncbi:MAG TPA: FAD-dependent monooxygenase [Euzebya sp.]|nr:FAD-dependent monooxygenase [Euzebya sp.]